MKRLSAPKSLIARQQWFSTIAADTRIKVSLSLAEQVSESKVTGINDIWHPGPIEGHCVVCKMCCLLKYILYTELPFLPMSKRTLYILYLPFVKGSDSAETKRCEYHEM